jgi:hypothetical protein
VHGVGITGVVGLTLLDQAGAVLWEGLVLTDSGPDWLRDFSIEIPYRVGEAQLGTLVAWGTSMEDGRRTNVRQHPVWLSASGEPTTTTLDPVAGQTALRYDLDKAVEATLAEIETIDAQLVGLAPDDGAALRTRAAELDQYLFDLREGLSRVYDELQRLGADFDIPCSGEVLGSELEAQPGLPVGVADLRYAVYEAARACDWDSLRSLIEDGGAFSYSFGESGDPVAYWQRLEFLHHRPMVYIAGMLQRPFGTFEGPDGPIIYAWPLAYTYESWAEVPQEERAALRPLYDILDLARFDEFGGYLGYRVGITVDEGQAIWLYAVTGD